MARRTQYWQRAQAAAFLHVSPLRIRNLSAVAAYGFEPALTVGRDKGSRRLYSWHDLCVLSVGNSLLDTGFTPHEVGRALAALRRADFAEPLEDSPHAAVLVRSAGRWATMPRRAAEQRDWAGDGGFALPLAPLVYDLAKQIEQFEADGR